MHNINFNEATGKHSFYSVKQIPWHQLGHIAENYETSEQVLIHAGLNYDIAKQPNIHRMPGFGEVEGKKWFTYRTDNFQVLGDSITEDYTIVQNRDAFRFFDAIAGKDGVKYETAGALGNGEHVFITAKLPNYIRIGQDDIIENYLFIYTRHDGKGSIYIALTPTRIVCNNTLNAALANCTHTLRIPHVKNALDKLEEAPKIMGMINTTSPILEQVFNRWSKIPVTDKQVRKLIMMAMTDNPEIIKNVKAENWDEISAKYKNITTEAFHYGMVADSQQLDTTKGTLFGMYNIVTGYHHNVKDYASEEDRIKSALLGGSAQQQGQSAFNLCSEFEKHGADILKAN